MTLSLQGNVVPGKQADGVKKELMRLLKADDQGIDRLFTGKPVVVRRNVDGATAEKYQQAFYVAGAICKLVAAEGGERRRPVHRGKGNGNSCGPKRRVAFCADSGYSGSQRRDSHEYRDRSRKDHCRAFRAGFRKHHQGKHVGRDIMASFKNLIGGEIKSYTKLLQESREQATERMIDQARQMGANAVVNVRYSTSSVAQGAAELYAYGTAVRVE